MNKKEGKMASSSYKNLIVWQKAIDIVELVYLITDQFPKSEMYGLASQMRRCAVSIASNIAEGYRLNGQKEKLRFLSISFGSGAELETQIIISKRLDFVPTEQYNILDALLEEVMRMLNKMVNG